MANLSVSIYDCFPNLQSHADLNCEPTRRRPRTAIVWEGILKSGVDTALRNVDKLMISTPRIQSLSSNPFIILRCNDVRHKKKLSWRCMAMVKADEVERRTVKMGLERIISVWCGIGFKVFTG